MYLWVEASACVHACGCRVSWPSRVCTCGCRVPWPSSGIQRIVCRSWFSLSTTWGSRTELKSLSVRPRAATRSEVLPVPSPIFLSKQNVCYFDFPQHKKSAQTCTRLLSGIAVMVLKLVLSFSKHTGIYLSKRIVKLAFSDWCRLLSIQLATYLKRNTEKLLLNKRFEKQDATEFEAPPSTQLGATLHGHVEWFSLFLKWKIFLNGPLKTRFNGHFSFNEKNVKETSNSS